MSIYLERETERRKGKDKNRDGGTRIPRELSILEVLE